MWFTSRVLRCSPYSPPNTVTWIPTTSTLVLMWLVATVVGDHVRALQCWTCLGDQQKCDYATFESPTSILSKTLCANGVHYCRAIIHRDIVSLGCADFCQTQSGGELSHLSCCSTDSCNCIGSTCPNGSVLANVTSSSGGGLWMGPPSGDETTSVNGGRFIGASTAASNHGGTESEITVRTSDTGITPSRFNADIQGSEVGGGNAPVTEEYPHPTTTGMLTDSVDYCYTCYSCRSFDNSGSPVPVYCEPPYDRFCVTTLTYVFGKRRVDKYCASECPYGSAWQRHECCQKPGCNRSGGRPKMSGTMSRYRRLCNACSLVLMTIIISTFLAPSV